MRHFVWDVELYRATHTEMLKNQIDSSCELSQQLMSILYTACVESVNYKFHPHFKLFFPFFLLPIFTKCFDLKTACRASGKRLKSGERKSCNSFHSHVCNAVARRPAFRRPSCLSSEGTLVHTVLLLEV